MNPDFVDVLLDQWEVELPGERFEALGVFSRLNRYGRLASRSIYANVDRFGLNETQLNVLAALHRAGEPYQLSPKELSTSMLVTSGALTYIIDQMEKVGNVERLPNHEDRRALLVRLTANGKQLVEEAILAHQELCKELLSPLTSSQQRGLINALRILLVSIDDGMPPTSSKGSGGPKTRRSKVTSTARTT